MPCTTTNSLWFKFNTKTKVMQGEDDLRGLAKIIAFMRAVSILLVHLMDDVFNMAQATLPY